MPKILRLKWQRALKGYDAKVLAEAVWCLRQTINAIEKENIIPQQNCVVKFVAY